MIGVDTNVLVRYLADDNPLQYPAAERLIEGGGAVYVPKTVLLEVEWVLRSRHGFRRDRVAGALRGLAGLPNVAVEDAPAVEKALRWLSSGLDFADALHLASAAGTAAAFATFDQDLRRRAGALAGAPPVREP